MLLPACGDGGPTGTDRPDGNGGVSGGEGPTELLVGTWRTVVVVEVPGDIQTWTTTWRFEPDGTCLQTVETESLAEGFPRTTERPCTFVARDFDVSIAFAGGGTLVFEYSFADFSPDRLILDGFEYERLA
ncbi:MAG TPA: hypothetical protein VM094_04765 [Gemmatimonadales bacterium]|nr:hypothetical protein [Gemmatimonadales bacterium]